jgi:hypothetical protein
VALPDGHDATDGLHPKETAHATTLAAARRRAGVGGRVALRARADGAGWTGGTPLFSTPRGAPLLPDGTSAREPQAGLAMALGCPADEPRRTLGVDLELSRPLRLDHRHRILTAPDWRRWRR